jgi:hypothetical protein
MDFHVFVRLALHDLRLRVLLMFKLLHGIYLCAFGSWSCPGSKPDPTGFGIAVQPSAFYSAQHVGGLKLSSAELKCDRQKSK